MAIPPRILTAYALVQAGDAVACAAGATLVTEALDRVECPDGLRTMLVPIKVASAVGLLVGRRNPRVAQLTGAALTAYFAGAIAAHLRVRDTLPNTVPAIGLGALSAWIAVGSATRS